MLLMSPPSPPAGVLSPRPQPRSETMSTLRNGLCVLTLTIVTAAGIVFAQAPAPARAPAGPPRGSSGPPEHAKIAPINNLPNPYETVRNWGTLPDGRRWGAVSAVHVD